MITTLKKNNFKLIRFAFDLLQKFEAVPHEYTTPYCVLGIRERRIIQNAVFCNAVARFTPYTFTSHTKVSIVFGTGRLTNYII